MSIDYVQNASNHSHPQARGGAPLGQHKELRPLGKSNFLSMPGVIISYSQPIRFVRLDSEHAQSDRKSVNRGLPVLTFPEVTILGAHQKELGLLGQEWQVAPVEACSVASCS